MCPIFEVQFDQFICMHTKSCPKLQAVRVWTSGNWVQSTSQIFGCIWTSNNKPAATYKVLHLSEIRWHYTLRARLKLKHEHQEYLCLGRSEKVHFLFFFIHHNRAFLYSKLVPHCFPQWTNRLTVPLTEKLLANKIFTECRISIIGNIQYIRRYFQY